MLSKSAFVTVCRCRNHGTITLSDGTEHLFFSKEEGTNLLDSFSKLEKIIPDEKMVLSDMIESSQLVRESEVQSSFYASTVVGLIRRSLEKTPHESDMDLITGAMQNLHGDDRPELVS